MPAGRGQQASQGADMTAISVQDITKNFGRITAVDALRFDVEFGTLTGFLGPNGAGKTTTLRMLLGLVHPSGGSALVDGIPYRRPSQAAVTLGNVLGGTGVYSRRTPRDPPRGLAPPDNNPVG